MSPRREFSGTAVDTTLSADIDAVVDEIPLSDATGWPDGPNPSFGVIETSTVEEQFTFTGKTGNTLTGVTRAQNGTAASAFSAGTTVRHVWTATDAEDSNAHIFDTTRDDHTQLIPRSGTRGFTGTGSIAGTPAVILGTGVAAGSANTLLRTDSTIVAFDTSAPTRSNPGASSAVGSAAVAARRDHTHGREPLTYLFTVNADAQTSTTYTALLTQNALLVLPAEAYTMFVEVMGRSGFNAGSNIATYRITDESGTEIMEDADSEYAIHQTNGEWHGVAFGAKKQYSSGATAGFRLQYKVDTSNTYVRFMVKVSFIPGAA